MSERKQAFLHGLKNGVPIAIGYFVVSFALGIQAANAAISPAKSALMSLLNLTSAGEMAGVVLIGGGATYAELLLTQIVINLRYLLMSCAVSQRILPDTSLLHRFLMSYGITDEIFAVSAIRPKPLSPYFTYGALTLAAPGWTIGTFLGATLGNILPTRAVSALGMALYAMFFAIVLPPARKNRAIAIVVALSMAASAGLWALSRLPRLAFLTDGTRIVILTIAIALLAAALFPIKDEVKEETI